jgi:hypothetical protein
LVQIPKELWTERELQIIGTINPLVELPFDESHPECRHPLKAVHLGGQQS